MAIELTEIEAGYVYDALDEQHRLVLGFTTDCEVVYADRGGNKMNPFRNSRSTSQAARFAEGLQRKAAQSE